MPSSRLAKTGELIQLKIEFAPGLLALRCNKQFLHSPRFVRNFSALLPELLERASLSSGRPAEESTATTALDIKINKAKLYLQLQIK